jgi:alpha-ketoglutarate-dependent taurine dioxygenase
MTPRLHENGWTVLLEDFDFAQATQQEIDIIGCLAATNLCVVAKNQAHLTNTDRRRVAHMFGQVDNWDHWDRPDDRRAKYVLSDDGAEKEILLITGAVDETGTPGLFGRKDTHPWHCNRPQDRNRRSLVWINGVEGTKGSRTSFSNHIWAYNDLSIELKEQIKDLHCVYRFTTELTLRQNPDVATIEEPDLDWRPKLVWTNQGNQTGLFLSWVQLEKFVELDRDASWHLIDQLRSHILGHNEKYIYHHDWDDGDVVVTEQWLSNHVRWAFDGIEDRKIYRLAFDYANIDLSKIAQAKELLC